MSGIWTSLRARWPGRPLARPLLRLPLLDLEWRPGELRLQLSGDQAGGSVALDLDGAFLTVADIDADGRAFFPLASSPSGARRLRLLPRLGRAGTALLDEPVDVHMDAPGFVAGGEGSTALLPLAGVEQLLPFPLPVMNPDVAIVIPAYNAADLLDRCLASVLAHAPPAVRVIVIDDASPDARVGGVLQRYRATTRVEVHRNDLNRGFTATANRGFMLAAGADVVVLNADAEVGPCWLQGLRRAAYSAADVATATAVSDNAGAFSVPELEHANALPACWSFAAAARAVWQHAGLDYPRLPTGNGFCMYVRRAVIDMVGPFDEQAFPQGYGEENDFCQRACAHGWQHVIAGNVLVRHARSASFGAARRIALGERGMAMMRSRWPRYEQDVGRMLFSWQRRVLDWRVRRLFAAATAADRPQPRHLWLDVPPVRDDRQEHWQVIVRGRKQRLLRHDGGWHQVDQSAHGLGALCTWLQRHGIETVSAPAPVADDLAGLLAGLHIPLAVG